MATKPQVDIPSPLPDLVMKQLYGVTGGAEVGYKLLVEILPMIEEHLRQRDYPLAVNTRWLALDFADTVGSKPGYARFHRRDYIQAARAGCAVLGYTHKWGTNNSMIVTRTPVPPHPVVDLKTVAAQLDALSASSV